MCVCSQQSVEIRVDEHSNWESSDAEKDLSSRLVLPIEHIDLGPFMAYVLRPGECDVQLRELAVELLDQLPEVLANRARVHMGVVVQVLNGQLSVEGLKARESIRENRALWS